ncbi:MAG: hypothetical protein IT245_02810 [Bacteroidia bacterium]|nr:hypothetical protein [Bacteroidia bacterium]
MRKILTICLGLLLVVACKKKGSDNPYDDWKDGSKNPVVVDKPIDPKTREGLHKNIFKPTCSNSGCHDGNFEPDFRTIESSYNSLINRMSTNTDPNNPQFSRRVVPSNAGNSMILHRIKEFIPGSQGKMPLSVDPESDWNAKKDLYIQDITDWINNGAKDQFGNSPEALDFTPQLGGLIVFADGAPTPLPHTGYNPVTVPAGVSTIKIMVAYLDDKTAVKNFGLSTINFTLNPYQYDSTTMNLITETSPYNTTGVSGENIDYWHSITVNVADIGLSGDVLWIRTETTDNVNDPVFIPSSNAPFNFKKYFAIRLN